MRLGAEMPTAVPDEHFGISAGRAVSRAMLAKRDWGIYAAQRAANP
jgi:hypothetical protein